MSDPKYVLAIDQGTTSTRAFLFDHRTQAVAAAQLEHRQLFPQPGWVEHDPLEIWGNVVQVCSQVLASADVQPGEVSAVGLTNQRETTVLWDRRTGQPLANAIVWQDMRTQQLCDQLAESWQHQRGSQTTGLPVATYFAGPKIRWLLDRLQPSDLAGLAAGTIDSWLVWNLSGGVRGGQHLTDVTNASRTMLMNLSTLDWDESCVNLIGVPTTLLPSILPSGGGFARVSVAQLPQLEGVAISGVLGDQQAALVGQVCLSPGEVKNTYGTGNFVLLNTGTTAISSQSGMLTTVAYQFGDEPVTYALEGSIAVTGALVQWLRDNLGIISQAADVETLASAVPDNGGCYIVPAFSGLFAPWWRPDARGVIAGLTRFVDRRHIARAALEAAAYQTRDVVEAMQRDSGVQLQQLKVDGAMSRNDLLLQFQADQLGVPVVRPRFTETTALGAAFAAGLATGFWGSKDELAQLWKEQRRFEPQANRGVADEHYRQWHRALQRSLGWQEP